MRAVTLVAAGVLLVVAYLSRNLGLVVELEPEYGYPAEPGDSLAIRLVDVSFPFVFGTSYIAGSPRLVRWRLTSGSDVATIDGGVLRIHKGGRVESEFAIVPPLALRAPQPVVFDVLPEPIAGITLAFARDTVAVGDTLRLQVNVRGASGRAIVADPMLLWPGSVLHFGTSTDSGAIVVTGRARCAGIDSVGVWIGQRAAIGHFVVTPPRTGAANPPAEDAYCSGRTPWTATVRSPWTSLCTLRGGHASEPSCDRWAFRAHVVGRDRVTTSAGAR
jgi:hypothetical protein